MEVKNLVSLYYQTKFKNNMIYTIKFLGTTKLTKILNAIIPILECDIEAQDCFPIPPRKGDLVEIPEGCGHPILEAICKFLEDVNEDKLKWAERRFNPNVVNKFKLILKNMNKTDRGNREYDFISNLFEYNYIYEVTHVIHYMDGYNNNKNEKCMGIYLKQSEIK